jgi:kumamolisin
MPKQPLIGSERQPLPGARSVGRADPTERLEISVILRHRAADALKDRVAKLADGDRPDHLKREEFAQEFGVEPRDIAAVRQFASRHGLAVVDEDPARRTMVLSGTVAQFNNAFGVDLKTFEHDGGSYRGRTGPIHLPDELNGVVVAVLGLDNRPQARPHFRARLANGNIRWHAGSPSSFTPLEIAALYSFPDGTAKGECIGIIELGGGYRIDDLKQYFLKLGRFTPPRITTVSVDHGRNNPTGDPNGPDGEVMLDIEVAGALAYMARIAVYFAPNTDAGFLDALTTAVHDTKNKPSVISISWGGPESSWTPQAMTAFDQALQAAAAMGITICVASGDNGSSDGIDDGADHVDFPASSPHCLACGGTSLQAYDGSITSEVVWNDGADRGATGGGTSRFFALPAWQKGLQLTKAHGGTEPLQMRGVPDVCAVADPQTGYQVRIDGVDTVIGGTSAVAPLWAALVARINSAKASPVGFINPRLYRNPGALQDVAVGNNGDFAATPEWDACTGLGSPNAQKVVDAVC